MSLWTDLCQKQWELKINRARIEYLEKMKKRTWVQDVELSGLKVLIPQNEDEFSQLMKKYKH